jgi:alpha-beta hydrolase superfamily lysophospholipase
MLIQQSFRPETPDGWRLDVTCFRDSTNFDPAKKPVLMIPGYAMNTFILNFHPTGLSMIEYLCASGFEVWAANLRGQGASKQVVSKSSRRAALRQLALGAKYGFRELGLVDIPAVRDFVLEKSKTAADEVHAIGCSLGATILYAYLAHHPRDHKLATLTAVGGPLRWDDVHPLVEVAFTLPALAGIVPIRGTRKLARRFLPIARRVPGVLSVYMNTAQVDLDHSDQMVRTVENPAPYLNYQIARWVQNRDLIVDGLNVTEALADVEDLPILCLFANADGIVPAAAARSVCSIADSCRTEVVEVGGDEGDWCAHADLFVSENAQELVFEPMSRWLNEQERMGATAD